MKTKTLIIGYKKQGKCYVLDVDKNTRIKDILDRFDEFKFLPYRELR